MIDLIRDFLKLAEELSGASVLTIVILVVFLGGYLIYRFALRQAKSAKKCGAQKQLLIGYIQTHDTLSPNDAISKANKMTKEALDDS